MKNLIQHLAEHMTASLYSNMMLEITKPYAEAVAAFNQDCPVLRDALLTLLSHYLAKRHEKYDVPGRIRSYGLPNKKDISYQHEAYFSNKDSDMGCLTIYEQCMDCINHITDYKSAVSQFTKLTALYRRAIDKSRTQAEYIAQVIEMLKNKIEPCRLLEIKSQQYAVKEVLPQVVQPQQPVFEVARKYMIRLINQMYVELLREHPAMVKYADGYKKILEKTDQLQEFACSYMKFESIEHAISEVCYEHDISRNPWGGDRPANSNDPNIVEEAAQRYAASLQNEAEKVSMEKDIQREAAALVLMLKQQMKNISAAKLVQVECIIKAHTQQTLEKVRFQINSVTLFGKALSVSYGYNKSWTTTCPIHEQDSINMTLGWKMVSNNSGYYDNDSLRQIMEHKIEEDLDVTIPGIFIPAGMKAMEALLLPLCSALNGMTNNLPEEQKSEQPTIATICRAGLFGHASEIKVYHAAHYGSVNVMRYAVNELKINPISTTKKN